VPKPQVFVHFITDFYSKFKVIQSESICFQTTSEKQLKLSFLHILTIKIKMYQRSN